MTTPATIPREGVAKGAMQAFLGLLVVNALVAIAAILGATGDSEWQVGGTTLLLTAGCLTVAANAAALERGRLMQLPYIGAGLSCLAFGVLIFLIWIGPESDGDLIFKATFIALTIGLAATYASMLAIADLRGAFAAARRVGHAAVSLLAAIIVIAIMIEEGGPAQIYAVISVVLATATIIVLTGAIIESRATELREPPASISPLRNGGLHCPSCSSAMQSPLLSAAHTCASCGLGFTLHITSPPTR